MSDPADDPKPASAAQAAKKLDRELERQLGPRLFYGEIQSSPVGHVFIAQGSQGIVAIDFDVSEAEFLGELKRRGYKRLVASPDDYQLAEHLLAKPMTRLLGGNLSDPAMRFFDRLKTWVSGTFIRRDAVARETASPSSVHNWISELYDAGLLEMVEPGHGRSPTVWRLTGATPDRTCNNSLPPFHMVFAEETCTHGHRIQVPF